MLAARLAGGGVREARRCAEELLGELTLEYNKGRQQKITAEILDLLGGAQ